MSHRNNLFLQGGFEVRKEREEEGGRRKGEEEEEKIVLSIQQLDRNNLLSFADKQSCKLLAVLAQERADKDDGRSTELKRRRATLISWREAITLA